MDTVNIISIASYMYDNVKNLIMSGRLENRKIVIFGANKPAKVVIDCLEREGISIHAIVDNNKKKREMISSGQMPLINGKYDLSSPEEILGEYQQDVIILIASQCFHDMCTQIRQMGYNIQKQVVQLLDFPKLCQDNCCREFQIDIKEMKNVELELLKYFKIVCNKYNLRYYLCGGTLLGAIRHQGYIPWDDDIDVFMPVPDYLQLCNCFKEDDKYKLLNMDNCETNYMFTRLIDKRTVLEEIHYPLKCKTGINIDIFPISGFPSEKREVDLFTKEIMMLREEWDDYWFMYGMNSDVNRYSGLKLKVKEIMTRYDFDCADMVGYIVTGKLDRELLPRKEFNKTVEVLFEGEKYATLGGYDTYLSNMYGNYMQLPSLEEQKNKHEFKAWKEG
ncbi:MAG: LicD family protein [Lachnospiraceae bacterium]|nr:LicD family protein [Lachnospiraceae bacterium]